MREIEIEAATVEDAIENALRKIGLKKENANITIIDNGSKGILGFNRHPAKVLVRENFNAHSFVENFFQQVINNLNLKVDAVIKLEENNLSVELVGEDARFFIGKYGCVLDSFQHILNLLMKKHEAAKIFIDAENYRKDKKESLERYSISCAKKVVHTGIKFVFKPMNSYERLVIHTALQNFPGITTYSDGEESNRHVVIDLKK